MPLWPYTWGHAFRFLSFPLTVAYRFAVTRTIVLGREHLDGLPSQVIIAGTHHSFPDMPLVHHALAHSPARGLLRRLIIAFAADSFIKVSGRSSGRLDFLAWYGVLALGIYPLRQLGDREASLRGLARLAMAGRNSVLIFPQGTHVRPEQEQDGDPAVRFRAGVGHLAAAMQAPVVPFGLGGTETVIPATVDGFQGRAIAGMPISITRGPLAIAFGPRVALDSGESPEAFTARLEAICYGLTRQAEASVRQRPASRRCG